MYISAINTNVEISIMLVIFLPSRSSLASILLCRLDLAMVLCFKWYKVGNIGWEFKQKTKGMQVIKHIAFEM